MKIEYYKEFIKEFSNAPFAIQELFKKQLLLFIENRNHPSLHNHSLKGELKSLRSININNDWRALFKEYDGYAQILFITLGTHNKL